MSGSDLPLSRIVRRVDVPDEGLAVDLEADASAGAALAAHLGIPAVERVSGRVEINPWGRNGLVVTGWVEAAVVQRCVVTFEPVHNVVRESFEEYFAPDPAAVPAQELGAIERADIEALDNQRIDVGALAVEYLVLGLDPYPRREGAELTVTEGGQPGPESGPFAALAGLRGSGR